ncbi:Sperm-associated antigen 16 protein [Allomyces arbusculus]|nr:Sperm-associated antigen 16 protein [Allomyces arbusculus]
MAAAAPADPPTALTSEGKRPSISVPSGNALPTFPKAATWAAVGDSDDDDIEVGGADDLDLAQLQLERLLLDSSSSASAPDLAGAGGEVDGDDRENEDLEEAIRRMQQRALLSRLEKTHAAETVLDTKGDDAAAAADDDSGPTLEQRPEVVDDFIRNFLVAKGMFQTLDVFQNEWYDLAQSGRLAPEDLSPVPDIYHKTAALEETVRVLRAELDAVKAVADAVQARHDKVRKDRDFFRMHHSRTAQEKSRLQNDVKRLTQRVEELDAAARAANAKLEVAVKDRAVAKLDRDKWAAKFHASLARGASSAPASPGPVRDGEETAGPSRILVPPAPVAPRTAGNGVRRPNGAGGRPARTSPDAGATPAQQQQMPALPKKKRARVNELPAHDRPNPHASGAGAAMQPVRVAGLREVVTAKAHDLAVSAIAFHPRKLVLATVSDDHTWKLWNFPTGDLLMTGEGHHDWISDVDFHPQGTHLATSSGDMTVKVWDFTRAQATLKLREHTQPVWSCKFHDTGAFLASGAMDHTAKLWDLTTGKCRQTFRGHSDSVNNVAWQPFTNLLFTCSGDKTVSAWDARSAQCAQTFFGHGNAINGLAFALAGGHFASCDADGIAKVWDVRAAAELVSVDLGPHPVNKVAMDMSGVVIAAASNDGTCKVYNTRDGTRRDLTGHRDAVQACQFDHVQGDYLVTCSSDGTWKAWN